MSKLRCPYCNHTESFGRGVGKQIKSVAEDRLKNHILAVHETDTTPEAVAARKDKKLNLIHDKFKKCFTLGFHTVLWRVIMEGGFSKLHYTFYYRHEEGGAELVIACYDGGLIATNCFFDEAQHSEELRRSVVRRLSKDVFGQSPDEHELIKMQSFFPSKKEGA